ncbi:phosphocarrier protein HPr [Spiroplasma endosymbiont of Amphibalanus improvisus]|uniref:phosphocarrier protein HPr n=1 Tax=Spiroplasma endosymbiont of Amphibalanus improvisus TaxID=3066327 RepID=UPI00313BC5A9
MTSIKVKVIDPVGLHARPAAMIVQTASKFNSEIKILFGKKEGNLKSIMSVMSLGVSKDAEIEIQAEGKDEEDAVKEIENTLKINKII